MHCLYRLSAPFTVLFLSQWGCDAWLGGLVGGVGLSRARVILGEVLCPADRVGSTACCAEEETGGHIFAEGCLFRIENKD